MTRPITEGETMPDARRRPDDDPFDPNAPVEPDPVVPAPTPTSPDNPDDE